MIKHILSVLFLASIAQAQTFREFLGSAYPVPVVRTPRFGIYVNTNDFNSPRWKRELKSENWLRTRGVPEEVITGGGYYDQNAPDFRGFCTRLWADSNQILHWTDEQWASRPRSVDPSTITVIVEPAPFWVPEVQQWRMAWVQGRVIRVAIVYVSLTDDGVHARVRNFRNELGWALDNLLR